VPERKTILLGEYETMKKILRRDKKAELSPGMQEAMKKANFSRFGTLAFSTRNLWKDVLRDKGVRRDFEHAFGNVIDPERLLQLLDMGVMHVRMGSTFEVQAEILGKDTKAAFNVSVKTETLMALWTKGEYVPDERPWSTPTTRPARRP
jgi:hypothetical protein